MEVGLAVVVRSVKDEDRVRVIVRVALGPVNDIRIYIFMCVCVYVNIYIRI